MKWTWTLQHFWGMKFCECRKYLNWICSRKYITNWWCWKLKMMAPSVTSFCINSTRSIYIFGWICAKSGHFHGTSMREIDIRNTVEVPVKKYRINFNWFYDPIITEETSIYKTLCNSVIVTKVVSFYRHTMKASVFFRLGNKIGVRYSIFSS